MSHVSNLRTLPAWTRSFILCPAKVIPRIFRIMDPSAVTARSLQGMARVRSGQAQAWPLVLTGMSAVVSRVKRDFACTLTGSFQPVLVDLRGQSRLGLEGRTRTLTGPYPDLTFSESVLARVSHAAVVSRFLIVGPWQVGSLCGTLLSPLLPCSQVVAPAWKSVSLHCDHGLADQ